ncbi:fibronectin-binding domain-containing protein [Meiothermus sp. QL-1]|uniref:Rqc2 family fibronectin-binding protein n=1 Tax=Meiothermus sp. QL-1 TaxID=2058095 RepID=UPI000E0AC267|nr:NFACT family protein [Meiothermus sp. QL-1]RDI95333.1 fibronectin-binding domain-containing protein [Meiothermus sp. QL-1]
MEGLLIHALVRELSDKLPCRSLGWAFPDESSAAVLLEGVGNLVLRYRPPSPLLTVEPGHLEGEARTPFQRMLKTRCKGRLVALEQPKLDRVVVLHFEGESGFVETPPTQLIFELTGRNANLLLCTPEGRILGLDRPVTRQINRYRELRPGLPYTPPPPYQKLDPRHLGPEELAPFVGRPLEELVRHLDGVGKELGTELARRAGLSLDTVLTPAHLPGLHRAIQSLVEQPGPKTPAELRESWAQEEAEALRKPLREALRRQITTLKARLEDYQKALERLGEASRLRSWGDLLLAYAHQIQPGPSARLRDFSGQEVEIPLEQGLSPIQNAERFYQRARRLEKNAEKALERIAPTEAEIARLEEELRRIQLLSYDELRAGNRLMREKGPKAGLRLQSPGGFEVWVGRSSQENELLTRMAHSEDLWFHAQGIPGSHVILRTQGRPASLPDLLFAARLAAYHSRARGEKNVPVDYTLKKHVWRPRKAAPGQVLYTQSKTLFVDAEAPEETG